METIGLSLLFRQKEGFSMAKLTKTPLIGNEKEIATAPYNFIPLPLRAIPSPLNELVDGTLTTQEEVKEFYKAYLEDTETHTGRIELTITTRTPCFIGGTGENFFSPVNADHPLIPGSSLRGMIKNILKIVTCGAMRCEGDVEEDFHNRFLYYRSVADKNALESFKNSYADELQINKGNNKGSGAYAGFLVSKGNEYYICPAKENDRPLLHGSYTPNFVKWHEEDGSCDCYTGSMSSKKHYDVIIGGEWDKPLLVDSKVIQSYNDDIQRGNANGDPERDNGYNLLTKAETGAFAQRFTEGNYDTVVPCFYMPDNKGGVKHFGFGRYYRIPYQKEIQDHVPAAVQDATITDFADAIFGKRECFASRVFFDDALLESDVKVYPKAEYSHPLLSPKPTSFQLYLEQNGTKASKHWNIDTPIRGYKLYWHNKETPLKWEISADEKVIKGMKKIRPIKAKTVFQGCIRFENLSDIELGALLKTLHLGTEDNDIYYKIGQGKSIGLGSVKIESNLVLIDSQKDIETVFTTDGWQTGDTPTDAAPYIEAFDTYMAEQLKGAEKTRYDDIMKKVIHMLDFKKNHVPSPGDIRMMRIDDEGKPFAHRWVLPPADEV